MRLRCSRMVLGLALAAAPGFTQQVPRPAGEFVIGMNDGSQILLSQYTGRVVLLVFMFTT